MVLPNDFSRLPEYNALDLNPEGTAYAACHERSCDQPWSHLTILFIRETRKIDPCLHARCDRRIAGRRESRPLSSDALTAQNSDDEDHCPNGSSVHQVPRR